jgi:mannose-6-phosphate isomerase-like protein (cupin superfamily)
MKAMPIKTMLRAASVAGFLTAVFVVAPRIIDAQAKALPAVDIPGSAIQDRLRPRKPGELPNLRVVDAGGHNVGVGVLYRAEGDKQTAALHYKVSEVYHVIQGSATFVTGGTLVNAKTRESGSMEVSKEDGPGASGTAIQGGVNHQLKVGDVIVIPAGTPHWFSKIDGSIAYLAIRVDPGKVIALQ